MKCINSTTEYFKHCLKLGIILIIPIFVVCSKKELAPLPVELEFEQAMSFFESRKYDNAIASFERIIFYHASSEYVDDAQFWLGRSYFGKKDYAQAIIEFEYLIKNFPNSQFFEQAWLYRAESSFLNAPGYNKDQTETKKAVRELDEFLTRFPNSKYTDEARQLILKARCHLAKKELENGKIYLKLQELNSALLYFQYVMDNYPETKFSLEAKYRAAKIYEKKGEIDTALTLYKSLLPDTNWRKKADQKIKEIEKNER